MPDNVMAARLRLIGIIYSPDNLVVNYVLEVGATYIKLMSVQSRTKKPRTIKFSQIRKQTRPTTNGMIIDSIRTILGL